MIECRTKCLALIHKCRTFSIFYWKMSDVRRLFRSLFFVWSCLSHLQKNIAQLITRSFSMIQSVSFTSAAFGGFCQGISMFFSICLNKKNAEVIKSFGILKNMSPRIKYIFVQERKAMFC